MPFRSSTTAGRRDRILGRVQVFGTAGLCAVGAELLAAYADSTGDVGAVLFALVFFMALYGAPALLARELARRAGWGWPSLLLLILALAIAQACIIDQSLFSEQYGGYEGWAEARQTTFIPALGVSAHNAYNFIIGHVIFSFGAPIAIAEAWRPQHAARPWLRPLGLAFAIAAYIGVALLIALDPQSRSASTPQLLTSIILAAACFVLAWVIGRRHRLRNIHAAGTNSTPRPLIVFGVTFFLVTAGAFAEADWFGFALGVATTALVAILVCWGARRTDWGLRHIAAVGLAFLMSRGILAFTYFPLAGEVDAFPKYAHNVAMMAVVLIAGWFALRPFQPAR